jgi:hypothetical protein
MRRVVGLSCWRQRGSSLRKQTLRMVESARPLMTPRADLANGVAGVVVVGALLSMESGTVPIGGGVGSQLAKVVAVGVQRSSLYILYTDTTPSLRIQSPDLSQSKRTERAHRPSRDTGAGCGAWQGSHPHDRSKGVHTTSLV